MPGTKGDKMSNFLVWMKNEHPLISIFCAHHKHPFSQLDRGMVLFTTLCWSFMWSAVFETLIPENDAGNEIAKSIIIGLITAVYEVFLVFLVSCGWAQKCNKLVRCIVAVIGYSILCQLMCYSIFFVVVGVFVIVNNKLGADFATIWWSGEILSFGFWFVINIPMFIFRFESDKEKFQEEYPGLLNIDG